MATEQTTTELPKQRSGAAAPVDGGYAADIFTMSDAERVALWKQRLFEAEAGMTKYLVEQQAGTALGEWFEIQAAIFDGLPAQDPPVPADWQRVFFRAQALIERFLVSRFGYGELTAWARANAAVHGAVERADGRGAADAIGRVARQAELYGSEMRLLEASRERAELLITHCGIWDYRERARARGVPLTLKSPCEFCTAAVSANIAARGYRPGFELIEDGDDHGCRWQASAPQKADR
ncbi:MULTISPECIES: hypothetical protein [Streptomyces]|uniref:L-2-amino-thiazoline-4-carboxylic acid hydrolase n=2 Tax=Streptomyces TaxID=1883 RepID=A0A9X8N700_9ACTN|nr:MULTISPECIES: hypothetical protein [Streptomyces]SHN19090.1 hypothetical protein SAMN05216268_12324 [Streptomyces yunnanensis]